MEIIDAIKLRDEEWEDVCKNFSRFTKSLADYRKTYLASKKSDIYFLGYLLKGRIDGNADLEDVVADFEEGWNDADL